MVIVHFGSNFKYFLIEVIISIIIIIVIKEFWHLILWDKTFLQFPSQIGITDDDFTNIAAEVE